MEFLVFVLGLFSITLCTITIAMVSMLVSSFMDDRRSRIQREARMAQRLAPTERPLLP